MDCWIFFWLGWLAQVATRPLPLVNLFSLCFAPSGFLHKDLVGALLLVVSTPSSPSGSAPCLELARRHPEALDHSPITTSFQSHETHIRLGRRVERPSLCRLCSVHAAARCHIRCCAGTDSRRALLDLIHIRAVCDRNAACRSHTPRLTTNYERARGTDVINVTDRSRVGVTANGVVYHTSFYYGA